MDDTRKIEISIGKMHHTMEHLLAHLSEIELEHHALSRRVDRLEHEATDRITALGQELSALGERLRKCEARD